MQTTCKALLASTLIGTASVNAAELEVTHWWTSGGEAAAVAELAKAFNATGNTWVDGAIAGSGSTARPIMISRITGGDPMAATQFNHGRQAEELVEAGLMRDLTDIAEAEGWKDVVHPISLLDACTIDGRIFCAPVNIHSWQWLWLSHKAFEDAGIPVPGSWDEYVKAAPALEAAGKIPLAMGQQSWQSTGAFSVLMVAIAGKEIYEQVYADHNAEVAAGPDITRVFEAADDARNMSKDTKVQDWNQATNMVITGEAGGQIMGDWAQGEFQIAGQVAGEDYTCLPGLGVNEVISTSGDAFYFPVMDNEEQSEAQGVLAATMLKPDTQVAFNLKKGSLPVRSDVNQEAANDCMRKGLEILAAGNTIPDTNQLVSPDTNSQIEELFSEFFNDRSITVEDAQSRFADIIADAD
ncbi:ABC transporter substrate-binding protein [Granulosicoccus sp. 3-233]|uniref:ABC transporter substrate-binding protein n=1 Tax=Granulosicoccus sp. 3-233 TaxID=3417969 RepID=UPI003D3293BC